MANSANVPLTFTIPNFYIPPTSTGTVQVQVRVDPSNPDIVPESNQGNNSFNHNITITTGNADIAATVFSILVELIKALIQLNLN